MSDRMTEHLFLPLPLSQVLVTCFVLYSSKDPSIHNTANVAIRQVVQTMFDRLSALAEQGEWSHTYCHTHILPVLLVQVVSTVLSLRLLTPPLQLVWTIASYQCKSTD